MSKIDVLVRAAFAAAIGKSGDKSTTPKIGHRAVNGLRPDLELAKLKNRAKPLPPEVLERRRAELRVACRVLDRSMTEPILNAPRVAS
jgi:hypothetical protein